MTYYPTDCALAIFWLFGSLVCLILATFWKPRHRFLVVIPFGMLVALLVFSMLLGRNRLAGWLWFVVPAAGFVAFAVGLFWINLTPPTPMHSQGTKPPIRLQIITEISRNLLIKSGFLILVLAASFAVTQALGMQEDIFSCLTYMLLICFAAVYLILAFHYRTLFGG